MSETIEDLKALKEFHKEERQAKAQVNIETLKQLGIPAYEQSKNVFRVDSKAGAVMFYPPSGKWQHRGRTYRGDVATFKTWLRRQHML